MKEITIHQLLEFEEGYRSKPYYCSEGYPTIGIGQRIGPRNASLDMYDFTCPRPVAYAWLDEQIKEIGSKLKPLEWFNNLNEARRTIVVSMCYQIGFTGVMKFRKMIAALQDNDWDAAEKQALDSLWARQTPKRARRHAEVLRTGDLSSTYAGLI